MRKITIIGAGTVGATIGYTMVNAGTADEIVFIDINNAKAEAEAMDINQGVPVGAYDCVVRAGDYSDAAGSDIVIITSGIPRKAGQSRLDLAKINVGIIKDIAPKISSVCPDAAYVIVSNPVDVLTYTFCKYSGVPSDKVIGSGTLLDTSRLRTYVKQNLNLSTSSINNFYVLGEHGDSSFIPWSLASESNYRTNKDSLPEIDKDAILTYVKKSGATIIAGKGVTNYAIAVSTNRICQSLLSPYESLITVSTLMNNEYEGVNDVCLSTLCVVANGKIQSKCVLPLTTEELEAMKHSADCLKEVIVSAEV